MTTYHEVLMLLSLLAACTACGLICVAFLKHDEEPAAIRKRQRRIAVLLLLAAVLSFSADTPFGYSNGAFWFIFACTQVQKVHDKDQVAEREAELAAARQAELKRRNAEVDKLAADLGLEPMPRVNEQ